MNWFKKIFGGKKDGQAGIPALVKIPAGSFHKGASGQFPASIQKVGKITSLSNLDRLVAAQVQGLTINIKKGEFETGDLAVLIRVGTVLPNRPEFSFLRKNGFRVERVKQFGHESHGLLVGLSILPDSFSDRKVGRDVSAVIGINPYDNPGVQGPFRETLDLAKLAKKQDPTSIFLLGCVLKGDPDRATRGRALELLIKIDDEKSTEHLLWAHSQGYRTPELGQALISRGEDCGYDILLDCLAREGRPLPSDLVEVSGTPFWRGRLTSDLVAGKHKAEEVPNVVKALDMIDPGWRETALPAACVLLMNLQTMSDKEKRLSSLAALEAMGRDLLTRAVMDVEPDVVGKVVASIHDDLRDSTPILKSLFHPGEAISSPDNTKLLVLEYTLKTSPSRFIQESARDTLLKMRTIETLPLLQWAARNGFSTPELAEYLIESGDEKGFEFFEERLVVEGTPIPEDVLANLSPERAASLFQRLLPKLSQGQLPPQSCASVSETLDVLREDWRDDANSFAMKLMSIAMKADNPQDLQGSLAALEVFGSEVLSEAASALDQSGLAAMASCVNLSGAKAGTHITGLFGFTSLKDAEAPWAFVVLEAALKGGGALGHHALGRIIEIGGPRATPLLDWAFSDGYRTQNLGHALLARDDRRGYKVFLHCLAEKRQKIPFEVHASTDARDWRDMLAEWLAENGPDHDGRQLISSLHEEYEQRAFFDPVDDLVKDFQERQISDPEEWDKLVSQAGDPNYQVNGVTFLHRAVNYYHSPHLVKALLAAGADASVRDRYGATALQAARRNLKSNHDNPSDMKRIHILLEKEMIQRRYGDTYDADKQAQLNKMKTTKNIAELRKEIEKTGWFPRHLVLQGKVQETPNLEHQFSYDPRTREHVYERNHLVDEVEGVRIRTKLSFTTMSKEGTWLCEYEGPRDLPIFPAELGGFKYYMSFKPTEVVESLFLHLGIDNQMEVKAAIGASPSCYDDVDVLPTLLKRGRTSGMFFASFWSNTAPNTSV